MPVIDVQVHPFDRNHPGRPWASPSHGLDSATGEEMVAAMNSVGVDGAIMVSSFSAYEYDPSYALEVYNTYPDKFRVVTPVDATNPAIDDVVAKWAATPGARGIRIRMRDGLPMDADHPGLNRAFAAAALAVTLRQRLPQPLPASPASRRAVSVLPVRDRMFASSSLPAVTQANFVRRRAEPRHLVAEKRIFSVR